MPTALRGTDQTSTDSAGTADKTVSTCFLPLANVRFTYVYLMPMSTVIYNSYLLQKDHVEINIIEELYLF